MKQGLTIQEMAKEILRQRDAKADYLVNTERLRMETCDAAPTLHVVDNAARIDYTKCTSCGTCVTKCPRKLIVDIHADGKVMPVVAG